MNLEKKIIGEIKGDFTTINLRSIVGCISLLSFLIRHHFPMQNLYFPMQNVKSANISR